MRELDNAICQHDAETLVVTPGVRGSTRGVRTLPKSAIAGPLLTLDGVMGDARLLIERAAARLRAGEILALKGDGGYSLACSALDLATVAALRARKGCPHKPLALLCSDLAMVRRLCETSPTEEALLTRPERPIVVLPARIGRGVASNVAPGLDTLGVTLPATPLQRMLLEAVGAPLVVTSGNPSGEPIAYDDGDAQRRLAMLADGFFGLLSDLPQGGDDSVLRLYAGTIYLLRRAHGRAAQPLPFSEGLGAPPILAWGSAQESAICLAVDGRALLSQPFGHSMHPVTVAHRQALVRDWCESLNVLPAVEVRDYQAATKEIQLTEECRGTRHFTVQHHHAHVAACLADNRVDVPVIGVVYDGAADGTDATLWGGEFLLVDGTTSRRAAHLMPFPLPGGVHACRQAGRIAVGLLLAAGIPVEVVCSEAPGLTPVEGVMVVHQVARELQTPLTTSLELFFDGIAALLGICPVITYAGQGQAEVEACAGGMHCAPLLPFALAQDAAGTLLVDWRSLIRAIWTERKSGADMRELAGRFQATVAAWTVAVCEHLRATSSYAVVALSGSVFCNLTLLDGVTAGLDAHWFATLRHRRVPCNDSGIALGQALIGARRLARGE
jgi:hydrogenase maturation protein HypF